jgi:hypothetical protein
LTDPGEDPLTLMAGDGKLSVRRLRLGRRIALALRPLEQALTLLPGENLPLQKDSDTVRLIRTDLILQSLDLRLRIVSLPGCPAAALISDQLRQPLAAILMEFPETAAVALVADDESLSARVIEPAELFDAVGKERPVDPPLPLPELTRSYLRRSAPAWSEPQFVAGTLDDLSAKSVAAATEARIQLQAKRKTAREAKDARASLDTADSIAISAAVLAALRGEPVDGLIEKIVTGEDSS